MIRSRRPPQPPSCMCADGTSWPTSTSRCSSRSCKTPRDCLRWVHDSPSLAMRLLMISGDRSILQGKKGAFFYTLEELSKHWERIDVITPPPPGPLPPAGERGGLFGNVFFHPSPRGLWYQPWWILIKGDELIKEHHHDVMTVHEFPPFYNGLGARWLHAAAKVPYMTEVHHVVGHPHVGSFQEWIGYWMSRVWLPRWGSSMAARVRVVSEEVGDLLREWNIPEELLCDLPSLYLDRPLLAPDPSIVKSYDLVFCARLVANKGLIEVLRAVAHVPDVKLLVIGDGPQRAKCERRAASLGIANRVTFAGWLPENTDVYRAIQSGKIFVMNSKSEGGPRVLFEAMALGMPVITTSVGLVSTVIKPYLHNGLLTTGTPADLQKKIKSLLYDEKLRAQFSVNARESTMPFERVAMIKQYAEALKTIATPHPSLRS
ncbi:glycosyltransferase [Candidatus Peribacteria bacterium]|nr:glycosyltransferase [Candidatus Peribacteria bacterium]